MLGDYAAFVIAAYAASALAIGGLGLWAYLDARAQRRALDALEARGIRRRSAGGARSPRGSSYREDSPSREGSQR